jgi:spore maturation protein CgeB
MTPRRIVFLGLSITSSWGNGHATNYRGLLKALARRGHDVTFLERDVPWYAEARDLPNPPFGTTHLYHSLDELQSVHAEAVRSADLVVVGSYVPEGCEVARWALSIASGAVAFYDIDTPVTLAALADGSCDYVDAELVPRFDLYLSFTGGPTLDRLRSVWGARRPTAFWCMVDPDEYRPVATDLRWELGYLGTYSADRQPKVDALLLDVARAMPAERFVVGGPQYPDTAPWPGNVEHLHHVAPADHATFYGAQRWTLNLTRADMVRAGWSPSVRLFEAAACGVPIVSDRWSGIDEVFTPGREIIVADSTADVVSLLRAGDEDQREQLSIAARRRVLLDHTADRRAEQLEDELESVLATRRMTSTAGG